MQEEYNPVKEYLFEHIKNSKTIPEFITQKKFDKIIEDIIENCYDKILEMGEKDEVIGVLATGILHYLLTNALLNSQRKVQYQNTELDIVIPDIKTLEKDPKMTLLICIPKSSDIKIIKEKISKLEKIHPVKDNIWIVVSKNIQLDKKTFVLSKHEGSFSNIIFEIAQFTNVSGSNKFKILKI